MSRTAAYTTLFRLAGDNPRCFMLVGLTTSSTRSTTRLKSVVTRLERSKRLRAVDYSRQCHARYDNNNKIDNNAIHSIITMPGERSSKAYAWCKPVSVSVYGSACSWVDQVGLNYAIQSYAHFR